MAPKRGKGTASTLTDANLRRSTRANPNPDSPLRTGLETPRRKRNARSKSGDTTAIRKGRHSKKDQDVQHTQNTQSASDSQPELSGNALSFNSSSEDTTSPTFETDPIDRAAQDVEMLTTTTTTKTNSITSIADDVTAAMNSATATSVTRSTRARTARTASGIATGTATTATLSTTNRPLTPDSQSAPGQYVSSNPSVPLTSPAEQTSSLPPINTPAVQQTVTTADAPAIGGSLTPRATQDSPPEKPSSPLHLTTPAIAQIQHKANPSPPSTSPLTELDSVSTPTPAASRITPRTYQSPAETSALTELYSISTPTPAAPPITPPPQLPSASVGSSAETRSVQSLPHQRASPLVSEPGEQVQSAGQAELFQCSTTPPSAKQPSYMENASPPPSTEFAFSAQPAQAGEPSSTQGSVVPAPSTPMRQFVGARHTTSIQDTPTGSASSPLTEQSSSDGYPFYIQVPTGSATSTPSQQSILPGHVSPPHSPAAASVKQAQQTEQTSSQQGSTTPFSPQQTTHIQPNTPPRTTNPGFLSRIKNYFSWGRRRASAGGRDAEAGSTAPMTPISQQTTDMEQEPRTAPPVNGDFWMMDYNDRLTASQKQMIRDTVAAQQVKKEKIREHHRRQNIERAKRYRATRQFYSDENRKRIEEFKAEEEEQRAGEKRKRYRIDDFVSIPHRTRDQPSSTFALVDEFFNYDSDEDEDIVELYERDIDVEGQPSKRRMISLYDEDGHEVPQFLDPESPRPVLKAGAGEYVGVKRSRATMEEEPEPEEPRPKRVRMSENVFQPTREETADNGNADATPFAPNGPTLIFTFTYDSDSEPTSPISAPGTSPAQATVETPIAATDAPTASTWTQPPPPRPTPAHATLPDSSPAPAATVDAPTTPAPAPATDTTTPMGPPPLPEHALTRARAEASRYTPARPSGLRSVAAASPTASSAAGSPSPSSFSSSAAAAVPIAAVPRFVFPNATELPSGPVVLSEEQKRRARAAFAAVCAGTETSFVRAYVGSVA
ncbi:MAG: hypothetical protein Q9165_000185 [Trypethelium subeluteriae]